MNGNKFATGRILKKPVEVAKGQILAGRAQKSPETWEIEFHIKRTQQTRFCWTNILKHDVGLIKGKGGCQSSEHRHRVDGARTVASSSASMLCLRASTHAGDADHARDCHRHKLTDRSSVSTNDPIEIWYGPCGIDYVCRNGVVW